MSNSASAAITIVGAGAWGTTLAVVLARQGRRVALLVRDDAQARELCERRLNARYLPEVAIPRSVLVTSDPVAAFADAKLGLFVVPSQAMRLAAQHAAPHIGPAVGLLSCAKGFERASLRRMSEALAAGAGVDATRVGALSGPNLAGEIARGLPASAVVAGEQTLTARAQQALTLPALRLYTSDDLVGVEHGGALKNVVAIAAGISDGMGMGQNAKAALMTRGLAEITRVGVAAGANPLTFAGLSGLGDLIATCESPLSRNRSFGERVGGGQSPREAAGGPHVIEGIEATRATVALGHRYGVSTPLADALRRVLDGELAPREAMAALLARDARPERDG